MSELPLPDYIERDPATILAEHKAYYEGLIGKSLEPAQIEMLLINNFAYREVIIRNGIQSASTQNLVRFATFPILDYLGELVGVKRLPASAAEVDIDLTLISGHGGVVIPVGLRVRSNDGLVVFQLMESTTVDPGDTVVSCRFMAQSAGAIGNEYTSGNISTILDPQAYLLTAINTTTSEGGADQETDEQLRTRIMLAPSGFSSAGPAEAYRFHAKSAHPSIIDVGIKDAYPVPGSVSVYPYSTLGTPTPSSVITAVEDKLNKEKIRPLNDTVIVASPTVNNYTIDVELTLETGADQTQAEAKVNELLQAYADAKAAKLSLDVVVGQIRSKCFVAGVYDADVISPVADIEADEDEINVCTGITVTTTGTHDA